MDSRPGMRLLKKAIFALPNSGLGATDYSSNGYIDNGFHFMYFFVVHPRIFYLFTKVNYAYFQVSLCFKIYYKGKKNNRQK